MSEITGESKLTTKEIVEQAISDYHESILPYLNGMVPTIANKFDKANLYSEDEQIVGRWIDGKPLYQKTVSCGALPNNGEKDIPHNISNIDVIVSKKGVGIFSSGATISLPVVYEKANDSFNTKFMVDKTNISFLNNGDRSKISTTYVTIQYTKTTDEAIAIGSDTDYSTTEKIIGTWIDGKPLYQKTIEWTGAINGNAWTDIGVPKITNSQLKDCSNVIYSYDNDASIIPVIVGYSTNNIAIFCMRNNNNYSSAKNKLTIQYTKTID